MGSRKTHATTVLHWEVDGLRLWEALNSRLRQAAVVRNEAAFPGFPWVGPPQLWGIPRPAAGARGTVIERIAVMHTKAHSRSTKKGRIASREAA